MPFTLITYPLVISLDQELMLPPESCPHEIMALIDKAACLHNDGRYGEALETYRSAQCEWEDSVGDCEHHQPVDFKRRLYFHLAIGSIMLSAGRYEDALERFDEAELDAERCLSRGHPNYAVIHSCRAFAFNALRRLSLAFEELVKV